MPLLQDAGIRLEIHQNAGLSAVLSSFSLAVQCVQILLILPLIKKGEMVLYF